MHCLNTRQRRIAVRVSTEHTQVCAFLLSPFSRWCPQEKIQNDIIEWLRFLKQSIGFDGWRFDFVRGYDGRFCKIYTDSTVRCRELCSAGWTSSAEQQHQQQCVRAAPRAA